MRQGIHHSLTLEDEIVRQLRIRRSGRRHAAIASLHDQNPPM
jgi:hypothetical protein